MRGVAALLTILALVLAGCVGTESDPTTDDQAVTDDHDAHDGGDEVESDDAADEPTDEEPAPEGNETEANTAPEAIMAADVLEGAAPLLVNFSLDGSDADGDALTWELHSGNVTIAAGDALPASANHTFEEGNHTVFFTVSDGELDHTVNTTIVVLAGAEEAAPEPIDMGWYMHDPVTNLCHVKDYDTYGPFYVSSLGGGTWVLAESNGVDGLQISNNHPAPQAGFDPSTPDCVDGDVIVV